jgi:hypothetical protein
MRVGRDRLLVVRGGLMSQQILSAPYQQIYE